MMFYKNRNRKTIDALRNEFIMLIEQLKTQNNTTNARIMQLTQNLFLQLFEIKIKIRIKIKIKIKSKRKLRTN